MKVIIIDDEKAMHLVMKKLLAKIPDVEIVGMFRETKDADRFLAEHEVHIAFVDINMPHESGMLFAKRMADTARDLHIVFVTSHKEYAIEAFDIYALDYIVKPVSLERLEKTVARARAIIQHCDKPEDSDNKEMNRVSIFCLGGVEIRSQHGGTVKWRTRKSAELFGYLLLNRGKKVSRVKIIADMFAGMPQKNADTYLNTTIYQLRKAVEPHGLKHGIQSDGDTYSLDIAADTYIDFVDFEKKLQSFHVIDASNLEQAAEVEKLYTGGLFGEKDYLWALSDNERLFQMYAEFAKKMAKALLDNKDYASATRLLLKLLNRNELDEDTVGLLLKAYAAQRNKILLAKQYESYTSLLHKELGIAPTQELVNLYSQLQFGIDGTAVHLY
ncbi:response regulator [Gordoniibacillus kamchatkensis]|uniref:response regulator n=1 Tax=Gordoniibacillus kamchatkensis TaxID=1590651 RepID=UPI00069749BD|nr:response regulator [Paenibacillus sp. VKM B-2647]